MKIKLREMNLQEIDSLAALLSNISPWYESDRFELTGPKEIWDITYLAESWRFWVNPGGSELRIDRRYKETKGSSITQAILQYGVK